MKAPTGLTRFGAGGPLAALLLVLAMVLGAGVAPAWRQEATDADAEADRLARAARLIRQAAPAPQASVPPFRWPGAPEAGARLGALLALAQQHQVQVPRAEQRLVREVRPPRERWALSMPAQARYEDLRRFLEAALLRDPALALDMLRLRREDPHSPLLQIEMQWSLHQRPSAEASGP